MKKEGRELRIKRYDALKQNGRFSFGVTIGDDGYCYDKPVSKTDDSLTEWSVNFGSLPLDSPMPSTSEWQKSMDLANPLISDLPKPIELNGRKGTKMTVETK